MYKSIKKMYEKMGLDRAFSEICALLTTLGIVSYIVVQLVLGVVQANDPDSCKARSIKDVMLAPAYALGCNLGKNRFDIHLN